MSTTIVTTASTASVTSPTRTSHPSRSSTSRASKTSSTPTSKASKPTHTTTTALALNTTSLHQTSSSPSIPVLVSQSLALSSHSLGKGAIVGFSVGIGVAFVIIITGVVSILHHRRHDHDLQDRSVGAHIPAIADTILSPLSPSVKYKMEGRHEVLVEPPEIEGSMPTPLYELHSPDEGEYGRMGMGVERLGRSY